MHASLFFFCLSCAFRRACRSTNFTRTLLLCINNLTRRGCRGVTCHFAWTPTTCEINTQHRHADRRFVIPHRRAVEPVSLMMDVRTGLRLAAAAAAAKRCCARFSLAAAWHASNFFFDVLCESGATMALRRPCITGFRCTLLWIRCFYGEYSSSQWRRPRVCRLGSGSIV